MKRVGILGGTFDPVHCGHMIIARAALEQYKLDKVLLMTSGDPPHKRGAYITPAPLRHEMVKLAAAGEKGLVPFDYEIKKNEPSYTVNTLRELCRLNPDTEYFFIIGADSLRDFHEWYEPENIVKLCELLVYPRYSELGLSQLIKERKKQFDAKISALNSPIIDISSTELRKRALEGKSMRYFVPDAVWEYIKENGIYELQ